MAKRPMRREERVQAPKSSTPEIVDPIWLAKAFAVMVVVALVCGYLTLCGLFYYGQWQLVLHPVRTTRAPATIDGVAFEPVRFGAETTGVPQLTGWWIAAAPGAEFAGRTILYLPGGDGSLADDQALLASLHNIGLTVFAIDYRGYGQSAELRPSERSMREDAEAAWTYLTDSRGLPSDSIVPYGRGLGAPIALGLTTSHGSVRALILDKPDFDVMSRVLRDSRARFVPVQFLFHERFALFPGIERSTVPKLILSRGEREDPAVLKAADPKMTVALPASADGQYRAAVRRFLDQFARPAAASGMVPTPAPRTEKSR